MNEKELGLLKWQIHAETSFKQWLLWIILAQFCQGFWFYVCIFMSIANIITGIYAATKLPRNYFKA